MDYIILIIVWISFSLIVASYSKNKILGYWRGFFISLFLSPVVGLIITLLAKDCKTMFCLRFGKRMKEIRKDQVKGNRAAALEKLMNIAHSLQRITRRSPHPEHYALYRERIIDKIVELDGEVPDRWKESAV